MIETLILNVNMANTKQLSRPEMLPEPFEQQAPEQDFWMKPNAHLFDLKLSKKRTKKKVRL